MYTHYTYKKKNNIIRDITCDDTKTRFYNNKSINVNQLHYIKKSKDTHAIVWDIEKQAWKTLILANIISQNNNEQEKYQHKYTELQTNVIDNHFLTFIITSIITILFFCYMLDITIKCNDYCTTFFDKF